MSNTRPNVTRFERPPVKRQPGYRFGVMLGAALCISGAVIVLSAAAWLVVLIWRGIVGS